MGNYPKRLIEVDLPIKRISAHSRREKSIRHGHISTLHIWWARRPLAACRAVICAALWPDPADDLCPVSFRETAREMMKNWVRNNLKLASEESFTNFVAIQKDPGRLEDNVELRKTLLDFIADFANWDNSTVKEYLDTSRALTQSAHEALGGAPGTRPLVADPFAGGGSIPLEALRVGADAFASDLNPVAILLNKVVLEYIPKYGKLLGDEVRKWGTWIKEEVEKELGEFYPNGPDGSTPIAYLWARTIRCEGPGCGAEVPLIRSLWLAKTGANSIALELIPNQEIKHIGIELRERVKSKEVRDGTVRRSSASCPVCCYTTSADRVREQFRLRSGGADDARLIAVRFDNSDTGRRGYRLPTLCDIQAAQSAKRALQLRIKANRESLSFIPDEELPYLRSIFNINLLGVDTWGMLFTSRQALSIAVFAEKVRKLADFSRSQMSAELALAVKTCLALAVDRLADFNSSLCVLNSVGGRGVVHTFGRQALGIVWDFMETNPFNVVGANWEAGIYAFEKYIQLDYNNHGIENIALCSATDPPLPDDSVALFATDPPYYDAVPYADLSDFFYVWLKRTIGSDYTELLGAHLSQKDGEIVQLAERNPKYRFKTREYFETLMKESMIQGRRILQPEGIGMVVFAHKTTIGWETQLQAMVSAGWTITASWPIDTERPGRLRALDSAVLASSIHLICRPREHSDGSLKKDLVGDWRDVLQELPDRIHEWMPRLAEEGVVGADAIFACLGPALEIFSRYSRVEKANGEVVTLKEYLEQIWAAVAREALNMIFEGADATGFEEDARLTAIWLWTLKTGNGNGGPKEADDADEESETGAAKTKIQGGFALEYDAARKIAQGLGAHLESLGHLVAVWGRRLFCSPLLGAAAIFSERIPARLPRNRLRKSPNKWDLISVKN
ncbi:MAG: DUF1156 domain-containing protein [Thermodesulfobacteriota bacterium]